MQLYMQFFPGKIIYPTHPHSWKSLRPAALVLTRSYGASNENAVPETPREGSVNKLLNLILSQASLHSEKDVISCQPCYLPC